MVEWSIRGRALQTPTRAGGINAEKGFLFQRSYAAWLLCGLLTNAEGVVALRYEGAQDIDLWLKDGAEIYVQVKGYETTSIDWAGISTIVSRFVDDLQMARQDATSGTPPKLTFRLVATGSVSGKSVLNLVRGVYNKSHATQIASDLNNGQPTKSLKDDILAVLSGLSTEFYPANVARNVFRLMAEARLTRFGVGADDLDGAIRALLDRLMPRATILGSDVLDWIAEYLPAEHPCSNKGSILSFIAKSRRSSNSPQLFYTSRSDIWQGIANDLDVPRDMAPDLRAKLLSNSGWKFLVYGPSGAGKSTLVRRVLWDLQQEGRLFALELRGAEPSEIEWLAMAKLAKRLQADGGPQVVLLIDDIHDFPLLADRVADLDPTWGVRVVATTWSPDIGRFNLGEGVLNFALQTISRDEAVAAAARVSRELTTIPPNELDHLLQSGQFVVLNIALLEGGNINGFGRRLLDSVRTRAPLLVDAYIDLCVCGIDDRSVCLDVLSRIHANVVDLVTNPEMVGLVFQAGPGRIRSGHRVLSEAIVVASPVQRATRILALARAVNVEDGHERRFGIGILEDLMTSGSFSRPLAQLVARAAQSFASFGDYLDVRRCARILNLAGLPDDASQVELSATFDRVVTGPDAAAYRSDWGRLAPQTTFDNLLAFYSANFTTWGWRNFLHMAKELDPERRTQALLLARSRLELGVDPSTAKVIIDLMNAGSGLPDWAGEFAILVLHRVGGDISVARAMGQLIIDRLRSAELFRALLDYATSLIGTTGESLLLARNLGTAARYADATDRRLLLELLLGMLGKGESANAYATIIRTCAILAEGEDVMRIGTLLGAVQRKEPTRLNAARHILRRKGHAHVAY